MAKQPSPPVYAKADCGYKTETEIRKSKNYVKVKDKRDGQTLAELSLVTGKVWGLTEYFPLLEKYKVEVKKPAAPTKVFEFSLEDLLQIVKEHPEAVEEDNEHIRLCSSYSVDDGKTWLYGAVKCGECNWEVTALFVRASTREDAVKLLVSGDAGLCGECFSGMLAEESMCTQ